MTQSSSDLPLLADIKTLARRLLSSISTSTSTSGPSYTSPTPPCHDETHFRIGFITPPFKDNKIPVTDHLHAHAYIAPADRLGWWRGIAYSPIAWYSIDDLIAEIRFVPLVVGLAVDNELNTPLQGVRFQQSH